MGFTHLHNHSSYSVLDGAMKLPEMIAEAIQLNQSAIALTDHGNLMAAYDFWRECTSAGIKPIIGYEAYVAPSYRAVKAPVYYGTEDQRKMDVSGQGAYTHMTLWAENVTGLRNLCELHSMAYEGDRFYRKPRLDLEMFYQNPQLAVGLIASTGCAGGAVPTLLRLGRSDLAHEMLSDLHGIFGSNLFIEVMYHCILDDSLNEFELNKQLINIAGFLDHGLVMTNDCHYTDRLDAVAHDALLCVQTKAKLSDEKRFRFTGEGFYLKSESEMHVEAAKSGIPDSALWNTQVIADRVLPYDEFFKKKIRMPKVQEDNLRQQIEQSERYRSEYRGRLDEELAVIEGSGFSSYFAVLADAVGWAKANDVSVGPGRGSVGGSLVGFVLGITDINPLEHGLLFERFLNPERVSLPDIDVDVDDSERDRFLDYLRSRHGNENVAQILTVGTIAAKAALKDAARVLGLPYATGELLVDHLPPPVFGRSPSLSDLRPVEGEDLKSAVRIARGLDGLVRSTGVHAAGVVISPEPLPGAIPVSLQDGRQITGFTAGPIEDMGFVKMDFLGLRNLGVIKRTLNRLGLPWSFLLELPLDDQPTYRMLATSPTDGVFQLDSPGMQKLLHDVQPNCFNDVAAVLALYRPGPMGVKAHTEYAKRKRSGRRGQTISFAFGAELDPILGETYGLIVYQEQIMKLLQLVGGYSLGEADLVRKAMGKKDRELLATLKPQFIERVGLRYGNEGAHALWDTIEPFADYAFNKAHSVGYGMISYWTAYLKCHHPREYMAELLNSVSDDKDRLPVYLAETKRLGIQLLPPDVNSDGHGFEPSDAGIHYGLSAIKGFGENAFKALRKHSPYKDLDDFFSRAPGAVLNAGVLRALVRSGALDRIEPRRVQLDGVAEELAGRALQARDDRRKGKRALFRKKMGLDSLLESLESVPQYVEWETQYLGIALTVGRAYLYPKRDLTEAEWDWAADLMVNCPGDTPVVVVIRGQEIPTEYLIDVDAVRDRIAVLQAFDLARL